MQVTPVKKSFGAYKPGAQFSLPDKAARHLINAGLLAEVKISVETPAAHEAVEISPRTGLPKRQYQRRDMQAAD